MSTNTINSFGNTTTTRLIKPNSDKNFDLKNNQSTNKMTQNGGKNKETIESSIGVALPNTTKLNPAVYIVFLSLLLDLLAFTMILPLLPSLIEYYKKNDAKGGLYDILSQNVREFQQWLGAPEKYNSVLFGGLLGSMYSFLQFLASPIIGGLSDSYGRRPMLLICLCGISVSYLIWAYSGNFVLFVVARFIGGLSKGNISLSMAVISDVSTVQTRNKGMALIGIAFSLGFIFGPMIGAGFALWSDKTTEIWFRYPALFATALAILDILFVHFYLKETLPKQLRSKVTNSLSRAMEFINIVSLFNFTAVKNLRPNENISLKRLGIIYFLYLFIYSGLEFTVTFLMYHNFGYQPMDQARMFVTTGIVMALLQGSAVRTLPDHKNKTAAVLGLYLIVPAFIIVGLAEGSGLLYTGMILFAISTAFVVTCMTSLVSKYGKGDQKGTVLGIYRSLGALARALGPIFASIAFWSIGARYTYIFGGLLLLIPTLMLQKLKL